MREIEEREAEAAIYNAKLYETEQRQSDWRAHTERGDPAVVRRLLRPLRMSASTHYRYVEKRLMEGKLSKLDSEARLGPIISALPSCMVRTLPQRVRRFATQIRDRDKLDAQIEACVCDLFERMRALEHQNGELTAKLVEMGLVRDTARGGASAAGSAAAVHLDEPRAAAATSMTNKKEGGDY